MSEVKLRINNLEYGGWKSVHISRGIEQIAGAFDLSVSDRWPGQDVARPIRPGDACTVLVDDVVVITGHVDDVSQFFDDKNHDLRIAGRDKTGDLVDCSAVYGSGEWVNRTILQIAGDLCGPFGISASADVDYGAAFPKWNIQESESVFECLARAARIRGLLLTSDGVGGLLITRASTDKVNAGLVEGENLLSGSGEFSWRDRFSSYTVKGQNCGDDHTTTAQNAGPKSDASDQAVTRYRPLIVIAEDQADAARLKDRAIWESTVRAGQAARAIVSVQGWSHKNGLWEPNKLVRVVSPSLNVDQDLLIVSVIFSLDESGTITDLDLCDRRAFELMGLPEAAEGEGDIWN